MQDLIPGEDYTATLLTYVYRGEQVLLKYLCDAGEDTIRVRILESKMWGDGDIWGAGDD